MLDYDIILKKICYIMDDGVHQQNKNIYQDIHHHMLEVRLGIGTYQKQLFSDPVIYRQLVVI